MDDLAFVRERIESYADYTNDDRRRLADEQIRAYTGEALARLQERLQPAGVPGEELARVLLRCQFADQTLVRALDTDDLNDVEMRALHAVDREIVALADRADTMDAGGAAAYVAEVDAALDKRKQIVLVSVPAPPAPPR